METKKYLLHDIWNQIVQDGLKFLIKQWQIDFAEAAHIMTFPRTQGFTSSNEQQYGNVFQRALIADILCDCKELLGERFQIMIEREVDYLLSCQRNSGVGGWSYFPKLQELPPDADDLAQVMQVLLRSGYQSKIKQYCEVPLSILVQDNIHPDGSFETWIIPANERTSEQNLQFWWVQKAWGAGADPDVMANLLYTLAIYDYERFSQVIQDGITYLENQQEKDGSWQSSWYHGPYYGTYVCLRLLALVNYNSPAIAPAIDFLDRCQQTDGGWGIGNTSDPLSTALALLSLADIQNETTEVIIQGYNYLRTSQESDKSWPSCRFIQMELGRGVGQQKGILFYGSRTITTAFVLKAALVLNISVTH